VFIEKFENNIEMVLGGIMPPRERKVLIIMLKLFLFQAVYNFTRHIVGRPGLIIYR
jgi:hypothetical protein